MKKEHLKPTREGLKYSLPPRYDLNYHTYGSRCIWGLARVLSIKPVHYKIAAFTFNMKAT